jgi:methyl-accepting chemotaxis protein
MTPRIDCCLSTATFLEAKSPRRSCSDYAICIIMNTGNKTLVDKDMRAAKDSNGLPFAAMMLDIAKRLNEGSVRYAFPKGTDPTPLDKVAYFRDFAPGHILIVSTDYITDIDATFWKMTRTAAAVIGILVVASIGIAWVVERNIVGPLSQLRGRMASTQGR